MRRRRTSVASDSLDLLLDTITNTFGGILLLAILLVLLVRDITDSRNSGQTNKAASDRERVALEQKARQLSEQLEIANQSLAAQKMFHSGEDGSQREVLMAQLAKLVQQIAQLRAEEINLQATQQNLAHEIAGHADRMAQMSAALSQLEQEVESAQAELKTEQERRTRTMDLPKEQITDKAMTVAVAKDDQLYLLERKAGIGAFQYNRNHFEESTFAEAHVVLADGTSLKVRSGQGIPMQASEIAQSLSTIDRDNLFLTVVVAPDAFGSFHELRKACVNLGIEYKVFATATFPVVEGRSNRPSTAQ